MQYRMCAGIMELSNALIYGNRLHCGSSEVENAKLNYTSSKYVSPWLKEVIVCLHKLNACVIHVFKMYYCVFFYVKHICFAIVKENDLTCSDMKE